MNKVVNVTWCLYCIGVVETCQTVDVHTCDVYVSIGRQKRIKDWLGMGQPNGFENGLLQHVLLSFITPRRKAAPRVCVGGGGGAFVCVCVFFFFFFFFCKVYCSSSRHTCSSRCVI